nr:bifunctional dihydroflavonol 4-reductase/flavanone 4-reductase [Quercus suber]
MSGAESKVVCVTGASGYIASWLVKLLLQHGYTVKATVRDPNDPKKTEHLLALEELRKDFICSKQTYWKKDLLILLLMDVGALFIRHLLFIKKSRIPKQN